MTNFFGHAKSAKKGYFKIQHNFRLTFACPNALKRLYIFAPKTIIYFLIINFRTPTLYVVALGIIFVETKDQITIFSDAEE